MSDRVQFEPNYMRVISFFSELFHHLTVSLCHFELGNGVVLTPKHRSFLALIFFLLI